MLVNKESYKYLKATKNNISTGKLNCVSSIGLMPLFSV